jgi:hypothetical protein
MSLHDAFFAGAELHQREIALADGSKHVLHFKELPATEFRKFYIAEASKDEDVQAGSMAKLISASLCDPDGKPAISYKQALNLKPAAARALLNAVLEINGIGAQGNA